ncbi:MAG: hypothetical protein U0736_01090 [Gemmataceae bacterium]
MTESSARFTLGWRRMFGFTWLTLRQAEEALKHGRLEEALRLVEQPAVRTHRKGGVLVVRLARAYVERGEAAFRRDDAERAWADLLQAEALHTTPRDADRLRQALVRLALAQLRALLQAGDTARAEELVVQLRQRQVHTVELGVLDEGLRSWVRGRDLAARGELGQAIAAVEHAARLLGVNPRLEAYLGELRGHVAALPELLARLHAAAGEEQWRQVVELAEQVLTAAPQHPEARALRSKAWRALEPETIAAPPPTTEPDRGPTDAPPPRFYLWIDGVGGYLVCLGNRLTFGQALPDARVDVPLVADVSRLHATLSRDEEGYVLEAVRPVQVNGAAVTRALLHNGDRVTVGASCQFLFRLPVPGNSTARLELTSGHRLPTSVDAVLLMAETVVLGPGEQAHVPIDDLPSPLVVFRHRDGLGLRSPIPLRLNGQPITGRALLPPHAALATDAVAFAIEETN